MPTSAFLPSTSVGTEAKYVEKIVTTGRADTNKSKVRTVTS